MSSPRSRDFETRNRLRVAAVEAFRHAQDRRERPHGPAQRGRQLRVLVVRSPRRAAPVIARDERDDFDFVRMKAAQIAVLDQVVRMLVMARVADVPADVVHQRGVFEPLAFAIGQPVNRARLIEERQREPHDLLRVLRVVVAPFGELERAAPPDVGDVVDLRDLPAVAADVVEHEPFAQREVAQRQLLGAETAEDRVEQHGAGDDQVGAPRVEARDGQALLEIERDDLLAQAPDLLGRDVQVAQLRRRRAPRRGRRDGAQAEDRARRADDAIEAGGDDLLAVAIDLAEDVLRRASARRGRRADRCARTARSDG